ncbi:yip3 [Drosophila busckii]|uniref:Yip3 n=1 Tax=Drosophila busckii TaxID=30019 RepID=A0A0M3QUW3_DROBS|nr:uncharacterized protein LOC108595973 [Drosophila busckii]ALC41333.1 yip3 [Drosophila busckii]
MLGMFFDEGIMLGVNMEHNIIYELADRIYCASSRSARERQLLLELSSVKFANVAQALELLCRKFEHVPQVELLLAGEDQQGLYLFAIKSYGTYSRVSYSAYGALATKHLQQHWTPFLSNKQAEQLAHEALNLSMGQQQCRHDLCFMFKLKPRL